MSYTISCMFMSRVVLFGIEMWKMKESILDEDLHLVMDVTPERGLAMMCCYTNILNKEYRSHCFKDGGQ